MTPDHLHLFSIPSEPLEHFQYFHRISIEATCDLFSVIIC